MTSHSVKHVSIDVGVKQWSSFAWPQRTGLSRPLGLACTDSSSGSTSCVQCECDVSVMHDGTEH